MGLKVLVTGGGGYIGCVLVPRLLEVGYQVQVLDLFRHPHPGLASIALHPNLFVTRGDCREAATLIPLMRQADCIIPLAAVVGAPSCERDKVAATTVNLEAIRLILDNRSRHQRILFPATNSGYGIGPPNGLCDESSPLRPVSHYARTKVEAEKCLLDSGNCVSFRLATVFGASPRMRLDLLVNDFVHRAVRDRALMIFEGKARRNFIHVRDVASAFLHGILHFAKLQEMVFNTGNSQANLNKLELCARIARQVPGFTWVEAPVGTDPDQRDYLVDNSRLERTGWSPTISLDDGIGELVKTCAMLRDSRYSNQL